MEPTRPESSDPAQIDTFDRSLARAVLVGLVTVKLVGVILLFDPIGLQAFDLPKSLFSRACAWLLAGVLLFASVRFGFGIFPRTPIHLAVAGVILANAVSALVAENAYVALFGEQGSYLGLSFLADMAVLYLAVAVSVRGWRDFALLIGAIAAASLIAAGYAAVQYAGLDPIPWGPDSQQRPFGTFGNPDQFAHFLSICLGGSLGVAASARTRAATFLALMLSALCLVLASVVATRGSLVGIGGIACAGAILYLRVRTAPPRALLTGLAAALTALLLFVPIVALTPLGQRAFGGVDEHPGRLPIYASALHALEARPLFGFGPDSFAVSYPQFRQPYLRPGYIDRQTSAHNWPLQTAATTGVVGLVALLALLVVFASVAWTRGLAGSPSIVVPVVLASAAYWAEGLVTVGSIEVDWVPWLSFGVIAAITGRRGSSMRPHARIGSLIVVLGAIALAGTGIQAFNANREANLARSAWLKTEMGTAAEASSAATQRDPGRAEYWNWLGLAREGEGALIEAEIAYAAAAARAPYESNYWVNLALVRARVAANDGSDGHTAIAAGERAVRADPRNWRTSSVLAELAQLFGRSEIALDAATRSIFLNAGYAEDELAFRGEARQEEIAAAAALTVPDQVSARQKLTTAVETHENATIRVALAKLALMAGDRREAARNAQLAVDDDPKNVEARELLSSLGQ